MTHRFFSFPGRDDVWRIALRVGILLVLFLATPSRADIVIVKSSDADPYQQADAALEKLLAGPDVKVRAVLVKQLAESGIGTAISTTDTVIAIGTPAASWLHNQLPEGVELVYCMVTNAQDAGLLKGSDCWGITTDVPISDQIKLIGEALPKARTVGILYRSDVPAGVDDVKAMKQAVPADWHVETVAANEHKTVSEAIDALTQKNVDVIWTAADLKLYDAASVQALLLAALRSKTPVWGFSPAFVRAGALVGVGVDPRSQASQTADLIKQLKDNKQAVKNRVQSASEYQIAVNLIVADQIGVTIPDSMVKRATFVFRGEK
jgi:putative ABC transport system substrate-binding protein